MPLSGWAAAVQRSKTKARLVAVVVCATTLQKHPFFSEYFAQEKQHFHHPRWRVSSLSLPCWRRLVRIERKGGKGKEGW
jgi:hypothetical protein